MVRQSQVSGWMDALARLVTRRPEPGARAPAPGPWQEMESWHTWFCAALIATAAIAAYLNSLSAPFVFDDIPNIVENPTIRSLWPLWGPLQPPGAGHAVSGRPVVNLTLALNYALGGTDVRGYHAFNLLVHLAAALALFGIVRRTLGLAWAPAWLRDSAQSLGWATALLWLVHPLQTESVTCVIQRTESLAGLFYLVALYGFIRGSEPGAAAPRRWLGLSLAACWVGVATKEILATAPLLLLLYDRAFIAGTWRGAWRQRRRIYLLLALAWVPLLLLMARTGNRGGTAMIGRGVTAWMSLLTQAKAITGYLQLALWPHPLIVDYGDFIREMESAWAAVWPQFVFIAALVVLTGVAVVRWPRWGFLGAWFFVILGPSSSFIPLLSQVRAEHRMYLPLAAVVWLAVLLIHRAAGRAAPAVVLALAAALGVATAARNADYESSLGLWQDTVRKKPDNPRAHYSLGLEYYHLDERAAAIREYREALRLDPSYLDVRLSLAGLLIDEHRAAEARPHLEAAIRLQPEKADDNNTLGQLLLQVDERERAQPFFEAAVRLDPENYEAHNNLGYVLAASSRFAEAAEHFRRALALHPAAATWTNLGEALRALGRNTEAVQCGEAAVRLQPDSAGARVALGQALAAAGRPAEAIASLQQALRLEPGNRTAAEVLRALQPKQ